MKYKTGYWDIHNHILPGVDDGASCLDESLAMISEEYRQGVRHLLFTPHYRPGMFPVRADAREAVFRQVAEEAGKRFPDLEVFLGCEVYAHSGMLSLLADARYRMAGTDAVLLEFSTGSRFSDLERYIEEVIDAGYQPVLAHVERYECLYEEPFGVAALKRDGAFVQVNAETFLEGRFSKRRKFAKKLLEEGLIDLVASDAHDTRYRTVRIKACADLIEKKFGRQVKEHLFAECPAELFSGK